MDYLCSRELERNLYHIFYRFNLSLIANFNFCIFVFIEEWKRKEKI